MMNAKQILATLALFTGIITVMPAPARAESAPVAPTATLRQVARDSAQYTGIPYQWGGTNPETGFDCSGFVSYLFQTHGIDLPRTTASELYAKGTQVGRENLKPGDLVFFAHGAGVSHVGIYVGGNKWISATSSKGIKTNSMDNPYWAPLYVGARRI